MWKKWIAAALIASFLTGCGGTRPNGTLEDTLPTANPPGTENSTETVGVYVDTTPSMRGFAIESGKIDSTYYTKCLMEIDTMITAGFGNNETPVKTTYYRVDTPLWRAKKNILLKAMYKNCYTDDMYLSDTSGYEKVAEGNGYDSLCLNAALDSSKKEDLFILITDFYENTPRVRDEQSSTILIEKLKELAGLDDGKIFGLIGIESQFQGPVCDQGEFGTSDYYNGPLRPFYVIVRGYPETVRDFCEHLKERINAPTGYCEASVFFKDTQALDYRNFKGCRNPTEDLIWPSKSAKVLVNESKALDVYEYYKNSGESVEDLLFTYTVPEDLSEEFRRLVAGYGTPEPAPWNGEETLYRIDCRHLEQVASLWSAEEGTFTLSEADGGDLFEINSVAYDGSRGELCTAIRLNKERLSGGIWKIQWETGTAGDETPWWEGWTYENGSKDYSKTERLRDYVRAMMGAKPYEGTPFLMGTIYFEVKER